jgi:predicted O-methyltransferase YrrM
MQDWIRTLFECPPMLDMGHGQSAPDLNLGLGWVYYGLARALRPSRVLVIGSWRGFVPLVLARALSDNGGESGPIFLDPSLADDFWSDPAAVSAHLGRFGGERIRHYRMTTQEFVRTQDYRRLDGLDLLFVDGYHTQEQARFDHLSFAPLLGTRGLALFHDSIRPRLSTLYGPGRHYEHSVCRYIDELRRSGDYEVFDLPVDSGVTLVRRLSRGPTV